VYINTYIDTKGFLLFVAQNKIDKIKRSEVTIFRQWVPGGDAKKKSLRKISYYFLSCQNSSQEFGSLIRSLYMIIYLLKSPTQVLDKTERKSQTQKHPLWKIEISKGYMINWSWLSADHLESITVGVELNFVAIFDQAQNLSIDRSIYLSIYRSIYLGH
jgi:hypothetical protein